MYLPKLAEREKAIELRGRGYTYSEILKEVPVAKSTLSLWLRSEKLSKRQVQRITEKRRAAQLRGAAARKYQRLTSANIISADAQKRVGKLNKRELWLIGAALYWAEGSKQLPHMVSTGVLFGNSDPRMLRVFLAWLRHMHIPDSMIYFELYVHETRRTHAESFRKWWAKQLSISTNRINSVYYKKGNVKTKRKNIGDLYHGLLRIKVRSSTALNRHITGVVEGVASQF